MQIFILLLGMSISVANTKTAVNAWIAKRTLSETAYGVITGLGPRPVFGDIISTDAEYTNVHAAQATYDASLATARTNYNTAIAVQRTFEEAIFTVCYPDQWVKLTALTGISPTTQYVGYSSSANTRQIFIQSDEPVNIFPDTTTA